MSRYYGISAFIAIWLAVPSVALAQAISVEPEGPSIEAPPVEVSPQPVWLTAEYLHFFLQKRTLPVLLTTGSIQDTFPGAIGQPNTQTVIGTLQPDRARSVRNDVISNSQSGMRLGLGYWLDEARTVSLEGNFMWLFEQDNKITENSTGQPGSRLLARPFLNVNTMMEDADPVAIPNVLAGQVSVFLPRQLLGTELNLRVTQPTSVYSLGRVSYLTGFRFLSLHEGLRFLESLQDLPDLGQAGNQYSMEETFRTSNHFYGGQVGLAYVGEYGPFRVDVLGKMGLGVTNQTVTANATTQIVEPDGTLTRATDRGLLVQPSNAGSSTRNKFTVLTELDVNFMYALNEYVALSLGYTALFWPTVAHPERQIDRGVNMQALQPIDQVGPARPTPIMHSEDFWLQGISVGILFSF